MTSRTPRPKGLTMLSLNYQKDDSEHNKDRVYKHLINQYTLSGFRLNGVPVSIPELAQIIKMPEKDINALISDTGQELGAFTNPQQIEDTLRSIASLSTNWAIQDRGIIMQQIELLQKSQGDSYKPFISGELNKALKTGLDANKNIMELYKAFFTSTSTNILNIYGDTPNESQNYVTPEEAFDLLHEGHKSDNRELPQSQNNQLPEHQDNESLNPNFQGSHSIKDQRINDQTVNENEREALFRKYSLGDSPDCRENRTGTDALRALEPQGLQAQTPDPEQVSFKAEKKNRHQNFEERRGQFYEDIDEIE